MADPFPEEIDERLWNEACRRAEAIREFLDARPHGSTAANIATLALELGGSQATTYRLISVFRDGGTVTSLLDRKRGRPIGHRTLDHRREETIRAAIARFYLKPTRPFFSQLVRDIQRTVSRLG